MLAGPDVELVEDDLPALSSRTARGLKGRVKHHLRDQHAGKWNYFSLYLVRSEKHLHDLESLAIRIAYPKGNKTRGKFGGAPDLRKTLKRKMTQRAKAEIARVFRAISPDSRPPKAPKAKPKPKSRAKPKAKKPKFIGKAAATPPLKGLLSNKRLRRLYKGQMQRAWVYPSGLIKLKATGEVFSSPSGAARAITKHPIDGWHWWQYRNPKGQWVALDELRRKD